MRSQRPGDIQEPHAGSHLALSLAILPDDFDPGQHVVPILCLKEIFTEVSGRQPEDVLPLGLAVGNVHQARSDADWLLLLTLGRGVGHGLPPVLAEVEGVGAENGEDALPLPDAPTNFLQIEGKGGECQLRDRLLFSQIGTQDTATSLGTGPSTDPGTTLLSFMAGPALAPY